MKNNYKFLGQGFMRVPPDEKIFQEIIEYNFNNNIKYIEACPFYNEDKCEEYLGNILHTYPRNDYFLCDKIFHYNKQLDLENFFNQQLKKLQTDYFDLYLIQAVDRKYFIQGTFILNDDFKILYNFLKQKKQEGKIKHIGFSFHDMPNYLFSLLNNYEWDCVQLQLNYYDWYEGYAKQLYYICKNYDLPIIVMQGLKGGLLGERNNLNPELGYQFLNTLSQVKVILNGSFNISQIEQNNKIINKKFLTQEDLEQIKKNVNYIKKQVLIDCAECNYCQNKCPQNIDIKKTFSLFNQSIIYNTEQNINNLKHFLEFSKNSPKRCIQCRQCEQYCPQHLPIPSLLNNKIIEYKKI